MTDFLANDGPIPFAHRGGSARWPENTALAFRGAAGLGYRYIETDAHLTRDGEIVLLHDHRVDRTTDGDGDVREMSLSELKRLDAGYRFERGGVYAYRGQGVTVPTLAEALAVDPDLRLNLEIKQTAPDLVVPLWNYIEAHDLHDRVLVASAFDEVGDAFRRISGGRVRTSPGFRGVLRFWLGVRSGLWRVDRPPFDALQVPPSHGPLTVVGRAFVRAAHAWGVRVHVWTINEPQEMRRLLTLGVDGIMTDHPQRLLEVMGSPTPPRK